MTAQAISSYLALCGNEIINAARLKAYIDNGIKPAGFSLKLRGCEGLVDILPDASSDAPIGGYQLPELDNAPWYDPAMPESANFAGLMVIDVTMSAPYSRTVTPNIGTGQTLGRLKKNGRTILVHGFLIGKTCCAVSYGKSWLTSVLAGARCDTGDCEGCSIEFLSCCPSIGTKEDDCITTQNEDGTWSIFTRGEHDSEYQRGSDFFRRMHGAGVIDGPNELSCHGSTCGCGTGLIVEVDFTLATASPYLNSFGVEIISDLNPPSCGGG